MRFLKLQLHHLSVQKFSPNYGLFHQITFINDMNLKQMMAETIKSVLASKFWLMN